MHEVLRRAIVDALGATSTPELILSMASPAPGGEITGALPLGFGAGAAWAAAGGGLGALPADEAMLARAIHSATPAAWTDPRVRTTAGRETFSTLLRPMTPLGQFRSTFIIAIDDEGIAIIDQHVAHERILFEQISERLTSRALESQRLLTPVVLDLPAGSGRRCFRIARRSSVSASRSRTSAEAVFELAPCRRSSSGRDRKPRFAPSRSISTASRPAPA